MDGKKFLRNLWQGLIRIVQKRILDALLCDRTDNMAKAAAPFGDNSKLSIPDRIIGVIRAINNEGSKDERMLGAKEGSLNNLMVLFR